MSKALPNIFNGKLNGFASVVNDHLHPKLHKFLHWRIYFLPENSGRNILQTVTGLEQRIRHVYMSDRLGGTNWMDIATYDHTLHAMGATIASIPTYGMDNGTNMTLYGDMNFLSFKTKRKVHVRAWGVQISGGSPSMLLRASADGKNWFDYDYMSGEEAIDQNGQSTVGLPAYHQIFKQYGLEETTHKWWRVILGNDNQIIESTEVGYYDINIAQVEFLTGATDKTPSSITKRSTLYNEDTGTDLAPTLLGGTPTSNTLRAGWALEAEWSAGESIDRVAIHSKANGSSGANGLRGYPTSFVLQYSDDGKIWYNKKVQQISRREWQDLTTDTRKEFIV